MPRKTKRHSSVPPSEHVFPSYFTVGEEGMNAVEKDPRNTPAPFRFWLRDGEAARVIILDRIEPQGVPGIFEHSIKHRSTGSRLSKVCIQGVSDNGRCPICDFTNYSAHWGALLTILNLNPHSKRKDPPKFRRELFIPSLRAMRLLQKSCVESGVLDLRATLFRIERQPGVNAGDCGNRFSYLKKVSESKLTHYFGEETEPFNYALHFRAESYGFLESLIGRSVASEGMSGSSEILKGLGLVEEIP